MNPCLAHLLLAMMISTEAPHEPLAGKIAVAYVAINRAEMSGQPLVKILRQPKQFALNPRAEITQEAWDVADAVLNHREHFPDPTNGADHFYNPSVKPWPKWYDERYITVVIKRHAFLKLGGF